MATTENKEPFPYWEDEEPDLDEEEFEFDCGMGSDGLCGYAGSEQCDFECPYRDLKRK